MSRRCFIPSSMRSHSVVRQPEKPQEQPQEKSGMGLADKVGHQLSKLTIGKGLPVKSGEIKEKKRKNIVFDF